MPNPADAEASLIRHDDLRLLRGAARARGHRFVVMFADLLPLERPTLPVLRARRIPTHVA